MENLKSTEYSTGEPGAKIQSRGRSKTRGFKNIVGGTVLALAAALGNTGCGEAVVIGEGNLLPGQDAGNDIIQADAAGDQVDESTPDAENDGDGNESDASPDSDAADNDVNEACNNVVILKSAGGQGGTIPRGATNVELLCVDFVQGCKSGEINELHFKETGMNNGGMRVMLSESYPQGARLTPLKDGEDANFENLNLHVEQSGNGGNNVRRVCLSGNVDKNALYQSHYGYELIKPEPSFMSNHPNVIMNDQVVGDNFVAASAVTGTIDNSEVLSIPPNDTLAAGQHGTIGALALTQGPGAAGRMQRFSLKIDGSCDTSTIKNLTISAGNEQLSTMVAGVNEMGLVHFPVLFNPYDLQAGGGSTTLYLHADQNCKPGENISVYFEEPSDLYVENMMYGFGETNIGSLCANGTGCKPSIVYIK
jgi:hypothetical protein